MPDENTSVAIQDAGAEVATELGQTIPAMGNVLAAIGKGVATSQGALDQGVVDTIKTLNGTHVSVVTQVVEHLTDDGLPDGGQTEILTRDVSIVNFFMPTFHEWKNVSVSMDMMVGGFHQEQGLQFSRTQKSTSSGGGLLWGFLGWFGATGSKTSTMTSTDESSRSQDVQWKQGQIQVDAMLGPRTTGKFPIPASVSIGPQIFVTQGPIVEKKSGDVVTSRSVELQIDIRKADGSANPDKSVVLNAAGLLPNFPAGNKTDANGTVSVTLARMLTPGFGGYRNFEVTASLGQVRKTATITL